MGHSVREERRFVRAASRRRRRGGEGRAPVPVQRLARRVGATAVAARDLGAAAIAGDRPYVVALAGLLLVGVVMLSGPVQSYIDGRARVALLERKLQALDQENALLEERRQQLNDPEQIELMAREQQGMIFPGEVPYVLVPPEVERPQIAPPLTDEDRPSAPWYARLWTALGDLFG